MQTPTISEAGWKFVINVDSVPRSIRVMGRHLFCGARLSITLSNQDLDNIGRKGDELIDGIYVAKLELLKAHDPCQYLMGKVMEYDTEKRLWQPLVEESRS
jgi:hypothetical protein